MEERGLKELVNTQNHWWWNEKVTKLDMILPPTVTEDETCENVLKLVKTKNADFIAVVNSDKKLVGIVTPSVLMTKLNNGLESSEKISRAMLSKFGKIDVNGNVGLASRILEKEPFAAVKTGDSLTGIITSLQILNFTTESMKNGN